MDDLVRWIAVSRVVEGLSLGSALRRSGSLSRLLLDESDDSPGKTVPLHLRDFRPTASDFRSAALGERWGIQALPYGEKGYPPWLVQTHDPPPVVFMRGEGTLTAPLPRVAVVGARACTERGRSFTRQLSLALARHGIVVVSGLARGVDVAAHEGALQGGGATWAVLAGGLESSIPRSSGAIYERLLKTGVAFSEVGPGTPAQPFRFPRRNRIIAGLAQVVVVVEAEERSGALITARIAAEEGREVMAVPGPVESPLSRGPHRLLRQGATLLESVTDVLGVLSRVSHHGATWAAEAPEGLSPLQEAPLSWARWFAGGTVSFDVLLARSGLTTAALQQRLLELEMAGLVELDGGGGYRPRPSIRNDGFTREGVRTMAREESHSFREGIPQW